MGFGITALRRLKEDSRIQRNQKTFITHLVVGESFLAVKKYLQLKEKFGADNVLIMSENPLTWELIQNSWDCSVHMLRNEECANDLIGFMPELEIIPNQNKVEFYKDTKFHPFGGRAKPVKMLDGESFFTSPYYNWKLENMFSCYSQESLEKELIANPQKIIQKIEIQNPDDLVEKVNFSIETGEFEVFECENIYWFDGASKFTSLVANKDELASEVLEYATSVRSQTAIVVHLTVDKEIYKKGTLLLPQSLTHDWGHFVVDFDEFDPAQNKQIIRTLIMLQEDDLSSEELGKKIRLFKRVFERVFPEFAKANCEEKIRFDQRALCYGMNDELTDKIKSAHPQLHLMGTDAPLSKEFTLDNVSRGLFSLLS